MNVEAFSELSLCVLLVGWANTAGKNERRAAVMNDREGLMNGVGVEM